MKAILTVLAIIIVVGGVGMVVINNKDDSAGQSNESSQQETSIQEENQPTDPAGELDPNNYTEGANIGDTLDATDQKAVTVSIDDNIFETTYLKIKKGTKITWVNNGSIAHDVTSAETSPSGGLDSPLLNSGETYDFTFDQAGVYEYFCTPHPTQMRGVITVVE